MVQNQQISMIQRLFSEGFSQGRDLSVFDEVLSRNVRLHDAYSGDIDGIDDFKKREKAYLHAFPDKEVTIETLMTAEDSVIVFWRARGTHQGDLPNLPATGNPIDIEGISIFQFSNGQVTRILQSWNQLGLLEQLGERRLEGVLR